MSDVCIAIGANLGDPLANIAEALRSLNRVVRITKASSIYVTRPLGISQRQPLFFNMVVRAETLLMPHALMRELHAIEDGLGRDRSPAAAKTTRGRTIDLDLICYDNLEAQSNSLTLPHPEAASRDFVLAPLKEIGVHHLKLGGSSVDELLANLDTRTILKRIDVHGGQRQPVAEQELATSSR